MSQPMTSARRPLTWLGLGLLTMLGLFLAGWVLTAPGLAQKKKPPIQSDDPKHHPSNAVANLEVHPELRATLFAHEDIIPEGKKVDIDGGGLTNPTNLDIDHRGRIWVCDVMNYRGNNGTRPKGDRILIYEDTDGDGKADTMKVFYQGKDIDSAMGICILGNKVIVSASPDIHLFHFDENDQITKREKLFTRTGQPQHDHSAHSFVFGPDGRLYWNFGNTGQKVCDRNGKIVVDLAGHEVVDNGKPYYGGMVFRCEMDGSNFEVLGHNFRNNYEVAVDSLGSLWQSDNDDDGNKGVRINYVMEYGNYGYREEMTGAGWQTPRTNMEKEIPRRHWHLNDPGVVPNLLQTGQGSPTGITVYEGTLLPKVFHGQIIHCDAGPSVVRAYPVTRDGAGYKATIVNILDGSRKNNWFRPADVCVAPDGSLFVTDWYDPGVGGHAQRDINRGRIFRVAPPGSRYTPPKVDFTTAAGACAALTNPALSVRYLAWTALHQMGEKAEPELLKLWQGQDTRTRARALWLLGRIKNKELHYVNLAIKEADPDIRITGLRLARERRLDLEPILRHLVSDKDAAVRRECALALRSSKLKDAPAFWARLAEQYDGTDRWYLEALGIAAHQNWDLCLEHYLEKGPTRSLHSRLTRDLIWRSRATKTPGLLAQIISDPQVPTEELPRYFRAFDFQTGPEKEKHLIQLAFSTHQGDEARKNLIAVEAIKRLTGINLSKYPEHLATLEKTLAAQRGSFTFVELVGSFGVSKFYPELLDIAQKNPEQQLGVNAVRVLLDRQQEGLIRTALAGKDAKLILATIQALTTAADDRATPILLALVEDGQRDPEQRRLAVRGLARTKNGAQTLVKLARGNKLRDDLKQAAGAALTWNPALPQGLKKAVEELFPLPPGKEGKPLPPLATLAKMRGDVARGAQLFLKEGTCANCHVVNGQGKEVGPNLSEIGKKLSREALLESVLYPSAGISHNYETWVASLNNGGVHQGVLVSQTPDEVTLKDAQAITRTFKRSEIDTLVKSPISLMPADLARSLTAQELTDIVEYLLTLREAKTIQSGTK